MDVPLRRPSFFTAGLAAAGVTAVSLVAVVGLTRGGGSSKAFTTVPAGTTIGGLPAAGLDRSGLTALLRNAVARQPPRVTVRMGRRSAVLGAADLGVTLDVTATVDRALSSRGSGRDVKAGRERDITPVLVVSDPTFSRTVTRLQRLAEVPHSDGDLRFDHGVLQAVPPTAGQASDAATIRRALLAGSGRLSSPSVIAVGTTASPPDVDLSVLQPVLTQARALLAKPPTLTAGPRRMLLTPSLLGPQLTVTATGVGRGHGLGLALRASGRASLVSRASRALATPATEPRLSAPAAQPVLREQGSVSWRPRRAPVSLLAGGRPGQQVTPDAVLRALTAVVGTGASGEVSIPTRATAPTSSDAAARTVNAVLGTFTTPFRCCQPRVRNITLMARTVDGTLIGPGQTFSLNRIVGRRTREKGYVEAPFILDGELSTDVGGGVSQFATTTLNAAYFAGLRIDRHKAHSFYISRYPPGREATVNYPTIDLQWTNTSGAPILVRATTLGTSLTVTLYGRDDGRTVRSTSGPRRPVPGRDFRITVTRVVTVPGRGTTRDSMTTTYNKPPKGE